MRLFCSTALLLPDPACKAGLTKCGCRATVSHGLIGSPYSGPRLQNGAHQGQRLISFGASIDSGSSPVKSATSSPSANNRPSRASTSRPCWSQSAQPASSASINSPLPGSCTEYTNRRGVALLTCVPALVLLPQQPRPVRRSLEPHVRPHSRQPFIRRRRAVVRGG